MIWKILERKFEWKDIFFEFLEVKYYWVWYDLLILKDSVLYKKWEFDCGKEVMWLIVLFKELQKYVMNELYSFKIFGYLGVNKILERVKFRFYWFNMRKDV